MEEAALIHSDIESLQGQILIGDVVFVHIPIFPFPRVARDTGSWTNHVGIVVKNANGEPVVAESTFPFSTMTPLKRFIKRSAKGRVRVSRLRAPLSDTHRHGLLSAASRRLGIFYDTGFNLHSRRQFCSRYVNEVVGEAIGVQLGKVETFEELFARNPKAGLRFWKLWYFGRIPWGRKTITPASVLESPLLDTVFDGYVPV
ncbi:MAG TPA: YebB family permuted papain-like enzyme [Rickettsiales bacterium]|nr:YebB family permuted papain-like enzyme [Rickettsiales bacterium]